MINVIVRRKKPFNNRIRLVSGKTGDIKSFIITGIGVFIPGKLENPKLYDEIKNYKDDQISIDVKKDKKIINIAHNKKVKIDSQNDNVTFNDWFSRYRENSEIRELFTNLDSTMKYIHNKNYCIQSFNPREIELVNNDSNQIKFNTLLKMPNDSYDKKELIKEDIYSSAFLQIGAYMNNVSTGDYNDQSIEDFLSNMKPGFLKENFDSFTTFIPEEDVPYYRGIIQRGASVYYSDFVAEKQKRDLAKFEREYGEDEGNTNTNTQTKSKEKGKTLVYSNGHSIGTSNDVNDSLYSQINPFDGAFVAAFILPIVMIIVGTILMVSAFIMQFS